MKRKNYMEPAIRIVKLQPRKMLMSSPDAVSAKRGRYDKDEDYTDTTWE